MSDEKDQCWRCGGSGYRSVRETFNSPGEWPCPACSPEKEHMKEKDQFPRFKKDDFGDGTGWLFAGGLVAKSTSLINILYLDTSRLTPEIIEAIAGLQDIINATMEAAYAPKPQR